MARLARVVIPGIPHHVTQRGNRRMETFFNDGDYVHYRTLLAEQCARAGVAVWAYCLMPNHVHLILIPDHQDGLRRALGETHRRYTRHVNAREDWRGHLWQERFHSFPMDESHLAAAVRYVELNPVRAGLVEDPAGWPWSSATAHLEGRDDDLAQVAPMLDRFGDWAEFLREEPAGKDMDALRRHQRSGRPLGGEEFVKRLEKMLERSLRPARTGRKPKPRT